MSGPPREGRRPAAGASTSRASPLRGFARGAGQKTRAPRGTAGVSTPPPGRSRSSCSRSAPPPSAPQDIPTPPLDGAEPAVRQRLASLQADLRADSRNGDAWGRYGMVLEAHTFTD